MYVVTVVFIIIWVATGVWMRVCIDIIPYDTGLEALVRTCSLLIVPEVLKHHQSCVLLL